MDAGSGGAVALPDRSAPARVMPLLAAILLLIAGAAVAFQILASGSTRDPADLPFLVAALPSVAVGFTVARRVPSNLVGPVIMLVGLLPLLVFSLDASARLEWDGADISARLAAADWIFLYLGPIALALVFPTGRLLSPRWRVAAVACAAIPIAFFVTSALPLPEIASGVIGLGLLVGQLVLLAASVVSVVLRYRRGDEQQRRQVRWLAISAIFAPAALVTCWLGYLLGLDDLVGFVLLALFVALPVSVGVALLRHELYGFDRVLSGAVRWFTLIALIGLLFATLIVLLGSVLGGSSPIAAAIATLACAAVFRPLQRSLRRGIDARFQPIRERALAAARSFVAAVRQGAAQPEQLETILRAATGDSELTVAAASIRPGRGSTLTERDLRDLEGEARLPLELGRLRGDLRVALEQTAASRARLVRAADEERGRIQRDLHDGAQQNLVALGMRLRSLQRADTARAGELEEIVRLVQLTIAELRNLAQGVRPSALDDGLESALRTMVRRVPLPVDLDLDPAEVAEPIATAAYYTAAEAVTNALKHADARRIRISLRRTHAGLRLLIEDDGVGGAQESVGSGLAGIRDRVEASGGRLAITDTGGGTRVEATFV